MKILRKLFGSKEPYSPRWNPTPPEQRPAPRRRAAAAQTIAPVEKSEKNPFLDEDFGDMELVNDVPADVDDPYTSATWKVEQENNERTLKSTRMVSKKKKNNADKENPYDTGVFQSRDWRD